MAQVNVTISGRVYRMACEEGQEGHLEELATRFDQYVGHLKSQFGEIGDLRLTVMAGIMVMDELSELNRRLKSLEAEVDTLKRTRDSALSDNAKAEEVLATALSEVTAQIQSIVAKVNAPPAKPAA